MLVIVLWTSPLLFAIGSFAVSYSFFDVQLKLSRCSGAVASDGLTRTMKELASTKPVCFRYLLEVGDD
jgi:hypothetical protein